MPAGDWDGKHVRVECPDGLPTSTGVYVVDEAGNRTPIPNLVSVTWTVRADEFATVTLVIESAEIDAVGEGVVEPVTPQA